MADTFNLKDIGSLLELLDKHEVSEFKLERENETIWLRRGEQAPVQPQSTVPIHQVFHSLPQQGMAQPVAAAPVALAAATPTGTVPDVGAGEVAKPASKAKEITSPMVGTFYRRPAADADPYVAVGDKVKKGDVLCIVEAMKLMNEIESDMSGTIVEICLDDGQMVEYGEPLFRIEP